MSRNSAKLLRFKTTKYELNAPKRTMINVCNIFLPTTVSYIDNSLLLIPCQLAKLTPIANIRKGDQNSAIRELNQGRPTAERNRRLDSITMKYDNSVL